eukprot:scaffold14656_cov112-Isochrysis_galbana.AAC.1
MCTRDLLANRSPDLDAICVRRWPRCKSSCPRRAAAPVSVPDPVIAHIRPGGVFNVKSIFFARSRVILRRGQPSSMYWGPCM